MTATNSTPQPTDGSPLDHTDLATPGWRPVVPVTTDEELLDVLGCVSSAMRVLRLGHSGCRERALWRIEDAVGLLLGTGRHSERTDLGGGS